eukprot:3986210-Amphidinium_carterae.1
MICRALLDKDAPENSVFDNMGPKVQEYYRCVVVRETFKSETSEHAAVVAASGCDKFGRTLHHDEVYIILQYMNREENDY